MQHPPSLAASPNRELVQRVNNLLMLVMAHCENALHTGEEQDMRDALVHILAGTISLSGFVRGYRPDLFDSVTSQETHAH
jgi:hypothetical protein